MKTLNQTLGFYTPAFFFIKINTTSHVNLKSLPACEQATFVHEYTHFIQDFATLYGLSNIYNLFDFLRLFVNQIYEKRKIHLPMNCSHPILSLNSEIRNRSWGSNTSYDLVTSIRNERIVKSQFPDVVIKEHQELSNFRIVEMEIETSKEWIQIEFGSLAIIESMAHLMEKFLFPNNTTQSPDYPYNMANILATHVCSQKISDEMIFALCDISLQTSIPGAAFLEMLQIINNSAQISNADDVYNYFSKQFEVWNNYSNPMNIVYQAKDHLRSLIKGPIGNQYQEWVDNILNKAINLRLSKPSFLLDIIRAGQFKSNTNFIRFVDEIGSPLITNSLEEMTKIQASSITYSPKSMDVEFFQAINYIYSLLIEGRIECPLQSWCKASGIPTDQNCIINPPAHSDLTKYNEFCSVGALWYHWNLKKYKIKRSVLFRQICH